MSLLASFFDDTNDVKKKKQEALERLSLACLKI